jgi:hypothetical protein
MTIGSQFLFHHAHKVIRHCSEARFDPTLGARRRGWRPVYGPATIAQRWRIDRQRPRWPSSSTWPTGRRTPPGAA